MKPILFNTEMVQAILEGRKSVTRRSIKLDLGMADTDKNDSSYLKISDQYGDPQDVKDSCRYQVGDILYVREKTFGTPRGIDNQDLCYATHCPCGFSDEEHAKVKGWTPSIHMKKESARIFLKVTNVRVERVQHITEEQALSEGIKKHPIVDIFHKPKCYVYGDKCNDMAIQAFSELWDNIYKDKGYGWDANPWVWVIGFERVRI